ncbi:hypothetical protein DAEQUDRAFT_167136 [Daedalea quercina L-15889]|uniref:RING-type domain-containing protein n=1 Tax=Daedalea quercina L-15889 TaxID=1314783 RepID=A0A165RIU0_9APHY|nr:hypothetical protein DAEQUDRAFT_167136 [Daedalea quercina L-15889]
MPLTALDSTEFIRTKREIESLRKQLQQSKKTIHKQSKVIDELKMEAANSAKSQKEQAKDMDKLKAQSKKSEELVANLEMNLSCQICMEILARPHGSVKSRLVLFPANSVDSLSPCGHVLCQGCLQNWFRSAPPGDDEMFDEDEPDALIYRRKTCPCCRTVVTSRPIPLFVVKSLTSVLEKAKAHPCAPRLPTPPPDDDPWEGIFSDPESQVDFRLMDEDEDEDENDSEDEDEDDEDDDYDAEYDDWSYDDEDEDYHGSYVRQRWEPPTVHATLEDYPFHDVDEHDLRMLRRGATLQMIDTFEMSYTHEDGLCARVDGDNVVYLGWNIYLHPQDESGEAFIDWIMSDMHRRPRRWEADEERNGPWTAWRLVPERDEQDYETTDSETWAADLAEDEDF